MIVIYLKSSFSILLEKQTKQSIMCDQCQRNQLIKIEKLRAFEPVDEVRVFSSIKYNTKIPFVKTLNESYLLYLLTISSNWTFKSNLQVELLLFNPFILRRPHRLLH